MDRYWQTWPSKKEAYCCRFGGAEVPGGAVAYPQITRTKMIRRGWCTKSPKFTANMQHAREPKFGRGLIGCAILLIRLSLQLHSSTCVWIGWELCCTHEALAWRERNSTINPFRLPNIQHLKLKLQTRRYIAVLESWAVVVASRTSVTLLNCSWFVDFSSFILLLMVAASQAAALSSMLCFVGPSWACSAHVLLPRSPLPLPLPTQYPPYRFHQPIFLGAGMPRLLTNLGTTTRQKRVWVFFTHYLLMSNRDVHDQLLNQQ
jgi:hypothetical protein